MAIQLTYSDIRRFAVHFDQAHGAHEPTAQDYIAIKFIRDHEQIAGDVNKYFIDDYLPSNPSVTAILDCYNGTPSLKAIIPD